MTFTLAQGRLLANGEGRTTARRAVTALAALGVVEITGQSPDSVSPGYTRKWGRIYYAFTLTAYGRMIRDDMLSEYHFGTGRGQRRKRAEITHA